MRRGPYLYAGGLALALTVALGLSTITQAAPKKPPKAPSYQVDPSWPNMPLPSAGDFGTPLEIGRAHV